MWSFRSVWKFFFYNYTSFLYSNGLICNKHGRFTASSFLLSWITSWLYASSDVFMSEKFITHLAEIRTKTSQNPSAACLWVFCSCTNGYHRTLLELNQLIVCHWKFTQRSCVCVYQFLLRFIPYDFPETIFRILK